jgi:hypothetical protein
MSRKEEGAMEEEIGVLHDGKGFRCSNKRTMVDREGKQNEFEERDTSVVIQIKGIPCTKGRKRTAISVQ